MKKVIATRINVEQLKNDSNREFNPSLWVKNVERYLKFENVEFYKANANNEFKYDRFFVVYTLPEGLRLMNSFDYSSSITDGGFYMALIMEGEFNVETNEFNSFENNKVEIIWKGFGEKNLPLNNSEESRKYMINASKNFNTIFTKI